MQLQAGTTEVVSHEGHQRVRSDVLDLEMYWRSDRSQQAAVAPEHRPRQLTPSGAPLRAARRRPDLAAGQSRSTRPPTRDRGTGVIGPHRGNQRRPSNIRMDYLLLKTKSAEYVLNQGRHPDFVRWSHIYGLNQPVKVNRYRNASGRMPPRCHNFLFSCSLPTRMSDALCFNDRSASSWPSRNCYRRNYTPPPSR